MIRKSLRPLDFYLLRSPHFSIEQFLLLNQQMIDKDIKTTKEILRDDNFLKAVYLSSRYFYRTAVKWIEDDTILFDPNDKILQSLYKYYSRICTRCTPYGLFAGFASGFVNDHKTKIKFKENAYNPIFRIDLLSLKKIKDGIIEQNRNEKLKYISNNTIYKSGNNVRFIEWDKDYNYQISEAVNTQILDKIIGSAINGETFLALKKIIQTELEDIEDLDAELYLMSLIESKLLVEDSPPYTTSMNDPLEQVIENLNHTGIDTDSLDPIVKFLSKSPGGFSIGDIEDTFSKYKDLIDEKDQIFQVDLKLELDENMMNKNIIQTILHSVEQLSGLSRTDHTPKRLTDFRDSYYNKFGDKEMPLVHALDPQIGVGYGLQVSGNIEETSLVKKIYFTYQNNKSSVEIPSIIEIILKKYHKYLDPNFKKPILLDEIDITNASSKNSIQNFNENYTVFGDLLSKSVEDLDLGNFKFNIKTATPIPFINNLLSRFAFHDTFLRDKIHEYSSKDSAQSIYAELVHQPSERLGNVLLRPNVYNYEIPYIAQCSRGKNKININDILVRIENNTIVLRSKKLNKEIHPRLSSAYDYTNSQLSLIRFLGDFQYQHVYSGFEWDWSLLKNNSYLPRIEYKELILSPARWIIPQNKIETINSLKDTLKAKNIPRFCTIKDWDNELLLDAENEICLSIICQRIKQGAVFLYESFHESYFLLKDNMHFAAEFIFPAGNSDPKSPDKVMSCEPAIPNNHHLPIRDFYPGGEWTYFKIFCSHLIGDKILTEVISTFVNNHFTIHGNFEWFFIRYDHPEHHLRLRLKTPYSESLIKNLNALLEPYVSNGYVSSIQIDTYKREIERYGVLNMELSEKIFHHDSICTVKILSLLEKMNNEELRWKTGVLSINTLLEDFEISLSSRILLFEDLFQTFLPEFVDQSNKEYIRNFKTSIDKEFRIHKEFMYQIISSKKHEEMKAYIPFLEERSLDLKATITNIKKNVCNEGALQDLLKSYIHMSLNRLFFTKSRMHELVIYFFLFQTYKSIFHRNGLSQ